MSGKALLVLHTDEIRRRAIDWINRAPIDTRVTFEGPKRTLPQNAKMWACLTDISQQVEWYGEKLTPDDWKDMLTAALRRYRVVPGIDGGFVAIGMHTSRMSAADMHDLLELIMAFGAQHGVVFGDYDDDGQAQGERVQPSHESQSI